MSACPLCDEPVTVIDAGPSRVDGRPAHRDCLLRTALGGIGHLTDHAYWCRQMHDPDGGRTMRQSGIEVGIWVREHGVMPVPGVWHGPHYEVGCPCESDPGWHRR